jgi:PAS domain S-box-containing protein
MMEEMGANRFICYLLIRRLSVSLATVKRELKQASMHSGQNDLGAKLNAIIETAIDGIITIDKSGIVQTVNRAAASMFLYDQDEIIGNKINMLMPDPMRTEHDSYIQNYLRTGERKIIGIGREVTGLRKDGTTFPLRLAVSRVELAEKVVFTGILHDLSEVHEARNELLKLNEQLEKLVEQRTVELEAVVNRLLSTNTKLEANEKELKISLDKEKELNELKSRFVSMASHEFRTPLSTILSSAALISRYRTSEQNENRDKHVKRIKSAVTNLTGILNDFLSLSKLEEGKVSISLSPVALPELCRLVADEVQGMLKEGQHVEYAHEGDIEIQADSKILKNVLFNLVSNAIKYSGPGTMIDIRSQVTEEKTSIIIKDEGIGIPEPEQKHLFNRFFRASNVETIQGTGLGLNIVKEYVDLLGGTVNFESIEGKGTTFTINLFAEQ